MHEAPPEGALVLVLRDLRGPADHAAVEAAIHRCDPAARTWVDWSQGLVAIASAAPHHALLGAVQQAGFAAMPQRRAPGPIGAGGVLLRIVLGAVLGLAAGLALGVVFGLGNSALNPNCVGSGNCAIGVGVFGGLGALLGLPVGAVVGLGFGLARYGRRRA